VLLRALPVADYYCIEKRFLKIAIEQYMTDNSRDFFCSSRITFYGIIAIVVTGKNLYKNNSVRSIPYPFFHRKIGGRYSYASVNFG